jgi:hypothetical protein
VTATKASPPPLTNPCGIIGGFTIRASFCGTEKAYGLAHAEGITTHAIIAVTTPPTD